MDPLQPRIHRKAIFVAISNGQFFTQKSIFQVATSDGVLKIASVRKADEGEYICTADNPSGTSTGRVTIFVRSGMKSNPF